MSSTQESSGAATTTGRAAAAMRLEAVVVPVADGDRAKAFYERLGWRLGGDLPGDDGYRVVQFTPPGSNASIVFGSGVTATAPGSLDSILLVVDDLDAALAELEPLGVEPEKPPYRPGGRDDLPLIAFVSDPDGYRIELIEV